MTAGLALQAAVTGLAVGAVYGLVALGFSLVHALTRVLNLAHGDVVVGALFVAVLVTVGRTPVVTVLPAGTAALQVALALAVAAAVSVGLYVVAIRPFQRQAAGAAAWAAATLAAGLLIRESLGVAFSAEAYAVADPLRLDWWSADGVVGLPGGGTMPARLVGVVVLAVAAAVAVDVLVVRSRWGRALRAVAEDRSTAQLMGIPAERVVVLAFVLAGLLAGLAGILVAPGGRIAPGSGALLGLKGAAAAVAGGLGSLRGAVLGGLAIGVAEQFAVTWDALGPAYADVLALAVLVVLLVVRRGAPEAVE